MLTLFGCGILFTRIANGVEEKMEEYGMWKKWIRMLAAMLTVLCLVQGAAAEGTLTKFFDAGCRLLFETDNVTLGGQAVFSLDGVRFKAAFGTKV